MSATPKAAATLASSTGSITTAFRDGHGGSKRRRFVLGSGQPVDERPVGSSTECADSLAGVLTAQSAKFRAGGDIEQGLLDRGDPARGQLSGHVFDIELGDITFYEDHPPRVAGQRRALFGYGDDRDGQGTRDRAVIAGRADAHEGDGVDAVVGLGQTESSGIEFRTPAVVAESFLRNNGVIASGQTLHYPGSRQAGQFGARMGIDGPDISRPYDLVRPPGQSRWDRNR